MSRSGRQAAPNVKAAAMQEIAHALTHHNAGRFDQAAAHYRKALAHDADNASVRHLLGVIELNRKNIGEALALLAAAAAALPRDAEVQGNYALALEADGALAEAVRVAQGAVALDPGSATRQFNLGTLLQKAGELPAALEAYKAALATDPKSAKALTNVGAILGQLGRVEEAIEVLGRAVAAGGGSAVAASANLCSELRRKGRIEEAIQIGRHAVALGGGADAHSKLGLALRDGGRTEEAMAALLTAFALEPERVDVLVNLSLMHLGSGDLVTAEVMADRALSLKPNYAEANFAMSLLKLMQGDLAEGWERYHHRWSVKEWDGQRRDFPQTPWAGEDLAGKTILIWGEQGIGDEIMLARFVEQVRAAGGKAILEVEARLVPLLRRSFDGVECHPRSNPPQPRLLQSDIDFQAPMGDLAARFGDDLADLAAPAYLRADEGETAAMRSRYRRDGEILVGLSWRGGASAITKLRRSIGPQELRALRLPANVRLVSLQYGASAEEVAAVGAALGRDLLFDPIVDPLKDMDRFAAQVAALDLVISVDNTTVHVAGALGRPTWTLLPMISDWRWLLGRTDTPWYGCMSLFRQEQSGDWTEVMERLSQALAKFADGADAPRDLPRGLSQLRLPGRGPVALLLNDTSAWYHWGCTGTSEALKRKIAERGLRLRSLPINIGNTLKAVPEDLESFFSPAAFQRFRAENALLARELDVADLIVINGEGTIHGVGQGAVNLLYLANVASRFLEKPVHLVNHSCYPNDGKAPDEGIDLLYRTVYGGLADVVVREPLSFVELQRLGIEARPGFDCLPLSVARSGLRGLPRNPRKLLFAGSVAFSGAGLTQFASYLREMAARGYELEFLGGARAFPAHDDRRFLDALRGLMPTGWRELQAASLQDWLAAIGEAGLFVSGRFHHSIAAICLDTPFVVLESNTPKLPGLLRFLGQPDPLSWNMPDLAQHLLARSDQAAARGAVRSDWLERLCALAEENFAGMPAVQLID